MIGDLRQDVRYGLRVLGQNPGFTTVAVLALTLGIGANTAIFSVVNAILLRPLFYQDPDRLVTVTHSYPKLNLIAPVSPAGFRDYRDRGGVFESAAGSVEANVNLTGRGDPERIQGGRVTASYFPTLGVAPALGRTFLPEEDEPGKNRVAVLSHGFWQRYFGADPNVMGQTVTLNGDGYSVIGVMPLGFRSFGEIWVPLALTPDQINQRGNEYLMMIARLKPGVSPEQAQAAMDTIAAQIRQEDPQAYASDGAWGVRVQPLHEQVVADIRPALLVLLGAVGFVLLIACANVANLMLARATTRGKEIAIRAALGAGRWRLVRQLLTESLLLALAGGGLGSLLAWWGVDLLIKLNQGNIPRAREVSLDGRVLAFTLGLSVLTGILFGLAPALQASKAELAETLKEGGRSSDSSRRAGLRSLLVVSEIALALVLLIGAGLMVKSFARLLQVDPGFQTQNLLTMQISLPGFKYREPHQRRAFYGQVLERVRSLPGVQGAATVSGLPLSGSLRSGFFAIEGRPVAPGEQAPHADFRWASPEYLPTMGIPLLKGRHFTEQDGAEAPSVAIIDETLARRYWPGEDPVGKRVAVGERRHEIVAVVGSVRHRALDADYRGTLYFAHAQNPGANMFLVVRTASEPMGSASAVRAAVQAVDPDQPVYRVTTMERLIAESTTQKRFSMLLLGLFAALALVLAAVGLYGVMSYSVTQCTHEIGVRMALGAERRDIMRLVVGQGMVLAAGGLALGLGVAFAMAKLIASFSSLLFRVSVTDPTIFVGVPLLLGAVALLACYLPARRATKVDPMVALRCE